jgi:flagellar hook-associated protein 1
MGIGTVMNTGHSALSAAKAGIATTGHNVANANTEGYSRQSVNFKARVGAPDHSGKGIVGRGVDIAGIERVNDEYLEKQIRTTGKDLANFEEKDFMLKGVEDIFNEMNGEGLNRLLTRFFNEFRKLSNEPDNQAVRQSVLESSKALASDFKRLRKDVLGVRDHIDSRLDSYTREANDSAERIRDLTLKIKGVEVTGGSANDLKDKRDVELKRLASYLNISSVRTENSGLIVEVPGIGPFVSDAGVEKFSTYRSPANSNGKTENALDISTTGAASPVVTDRIKGGKIGALIDVRDTTVSSILNRLDELAFTLSKSVNEIHQQGFTKNGEQGISFFKNLISKERAAEFIDIRACLKIQTILQPQRRQTHPATIELQLRFRVFKDFV